jgi:hypothetical protein
MTDHRTADRVSRTLMVVGTTLASVAAAVWMADALPTFPDWMLRLAVYKLAFASGAGLLIAGAVVRRSLKPSGAPAPPPEQLDAGATDFGRTPDASRRGATPLPVKQRGNTNP